VSSIARGAVDRESVRDRVAELLRDGPQTHADLIDEIGADHNTISAALTWCKRHPEEVGGPVINQGDRHRGVWVIPTRGRRRRR
jgi:hypothetical protein